MSPLVIVGGASVAAIAIGLVAAGAIAHLHWVVSDEARRRRARRRRGSLPGRFSA